MDVKKKNSETRTAIITTLTALAFGIVIILLFAYVFIPSLLEDTSQKIKRSFATQLYEMTFEEPVTAAQSETTSQPETTPKPTAAAQAFTQPDDEPVIFVPRDSFLAVLETNDDIVGRINVAPDIKYLVTQAEDNKFYLDHGYRQEKSKEGTIFLDYRCNTKLDELKGHYILYGHHMKRGTMFAHLMDYKDEDFFRENNIIRFDTLYENYRWEIFSAYVTKTDFYFIDTVFADQDEWFSFLTLVQDKSMFHTDVELKPDDVILTLCTCTYEYDDARFVIHAKLIK